MNKHHFHDNGWYWWHWWHELTITSIGGMWWHGKMGQKSAFTLSLGHHATKGHSCQQFKTKCVYRGMAEKKPRFFMAFVERKNGQPPFDTE